MFRGLLRPGQGFRVFHVLSRTGTKTPTGRPVTGEIEERGIVVGIISQASQKQIEQWKQNGHPISHTIVERGTFNQAKATDILQLDGTNRRFLVQGRQDPGELGHFTIYYVDERMDLQ